MQLTPHPCQLHLTLSICTSSDAYGTSSGNLTETSPSGILTGLTPGTKYYFQYYVTVQGTGEYSSKIETFYSDEASFTTASISTWLTNYEIPATDASEMTESNTQYAGRYCHYAVSAETKLGPMTLLSTRAGSRISVLHISPLHLPPDSATTVVTR